MWGIREHGWQWLVLLAALLVAFGAAVTIHQLLIRVLTRLAGRAAPEAGPLLLGRLRRPLRWLLVAAALWLAVELAGVPAALGRFTTHIFSMAVIVLVAWLLVATAYALSDIILLRFDRSAKDNIRARAVQTQVSVLRRIVIAVIVVVGLASALMTFDRVRQLGAALLASAGIAGIVVGLAAQKTLGNLIAGLQIAITQPVRIDDIVVVEGEWGHVEEITLTYVVIKTLDLRRLIVPITYFIERPFQNWTRAGTDLLGTVVLRVEYGVPVDAVRVELQRILESTPLWDRKVGQLQVSDATERLVELRILVSAPDSGTSWDLRCHVREKLIEFLRERYPRA
jgi:small-conductance mechanosensitive channel